MTETLFRWDESFLIGIEELDHEHKVLVDDINRLHEELASSDKSEIAKWLGEYVHACRLTLHLKNMS
jgi:hemerythrin